MEAVVILLVIIAVVAVAGVLIYNGLVSRRNRVDEAVGQIAVSYTHLTLPTKRIV